ncbi:zinc transporter ZIP1-like [Hemiscyllium ocellatum]|uniref:zinc transporter ZIP1-like n=1 Tax=Hemiscyllium ocellatum TaxID=170820 RepID=UPI0029668D71|nr:zinc transporter ZIP1-like [Hemiscyllium ocellatum]
MELFMIQVGCLVALMLLPTLCGLFPVTARIRLAAATSSQQFLLSLCSSFAGGVFLAACLLDVLPDYFFHINEELEKLQIQTNFPIPEFVIAVGFFLVLSIERIILQCHNDHFHETTAILPTTFLCNDDISHHVQINSNSVETTDHHVHLVNAHPAFRSFILFLSLSLHSIFEGLPIGLQQSESKVFQIFAAILIHKSLIVFSLSLKLVQNNMPQGRVVLYVIIFAVMSPLGIVIGIIITQMKSTYSDMAQSLLEGITTGTFVYVTFLEILPHELNSTDKQLLKLLGIIFGFSTITMLSFIL